MMPRMWQAGAPGPGRRALLLGSLGALPLLAGCGIRLEDDAPRVPLLPTRALLASEDLLTALTRGCVDLAGLAGRAPGPVAAALVPVHQRQHTVLRTTLVRMGVPVAVVDASSAPGWPSPSATAVTAQRLGAAEAGWAAGASRFAGVAQELRASVAALHAQRFAAAVLLTGDPPGAAGGPVTDDVVAELAAGTRGAAYFLEVVAARSRTALRTRAESTLESLQRLAADQVAGGSEPPVELGHPLPFAVRTDADAVRLARRALTAARDEYGVRLGPLVGRHGAAGWSATTRWLGTLEAECGRWGLPLQPFPSLT